MGSLVRVFTAAFVATLFALPALASPPDPQVLIYGTEGNRLRRYDVDTIDTGLVEDILEYSASDDPINGRDSNGMICRFHDGTGRYVLGEDTGQTAVPAGHGLFSPDGTQIGKLTPTYQVYGSGQPEPYGCAIRDDGILLTTDVGEQGFGFNNGQLIMWFPPYDVFPGPPGTYPNGATSTNFCKIDTTLGTTAGVLIDQSNGDVYVAASSQLTVYKYSGVWPTGTDAAHGCADVDAVGSPLVTAGNITKSVFIAPNGISTYTGLHWGPGNNSIYVSSVLEGKIREYDLAGTFIRDIVTHAVPAGTLPTPYGNPQCIDTGPDGTVYYADLDLQGVLPNVGTGPNGKVWRVRFDNLGNPQTPEIVRQNLSFPDGVTVLSGDLEAPRRRTYLGGPKRQSFYSEESIITAANAANLQERWTFTSGGAVTGAPTVADVEVPGEGTVRVTYFVSWDRKVYALRVADGSELWSVLTDEQPNATFPTAATPDVTDIDGTDVVLIGAGEVFYALDAASGAELWRFTVGTGCGTLGVGGPFPGYCNAAGDDERNQIEGSAIVADGTIFVTMDVNDKAVGKGGMYGLDARDGRMLWFFDLESGQTCRPLATDNIRQYDPYHSEAELNLPAGFLASRPGCNHPRNRNGCGNIWSSPSIDFEREAMYIASSNCDIGGPSEPPGPAMPPYDEAIFSLTFEGDPVWVWRPREVDNADLAFGSAPNLFQIDFGGDVRDVLGVGGKDGTYYVIDRDGVNEVSGVAWDDPGPKPLAVPYWQTQVVTGGDIGGVIASSSVDEGNRRIYFSTAAGDSMINDPGTGQPAQQPTLHALDMDSGAVVWENDAGNGFTPPESASYAPTSAIPGVTFFGGIPGAQFRVHDSATGAELVNINLGNAAMASVATILDGLVLVGDGIGPGVTAGIPSDITAFCVPGTLGCAPCDNGVDDDLDGYTDYPDDAGCLSATDLSELAQCNDGIDNDHDGNTDYPDDIGCRNRLPRAQEAPECADGVDNDLDGDTDYPDDLTCLAAWGESETDPPPPAPACGLLGIEMLLAVGGARVIGRIRKRKLSDPDNAARERRS